MKAGCVDIYICNNGDGEENFRRSLSAYAKEGGFDPEEIRLATEAGIQPITLGKRILRTETAGFTTIAWLMYQLEN